MEQKTEPDVKMKYTWTGLPATSLKLAVEASSGLKAGHKFLGDLHTNTCFVFVC